MLYNSYDDWSKNFAWPSSAAAAGRAFLRCGSGIRGQGLETWSRLRSAVRTHVLRHRLERLQPDVCGCGGFTEMKKIVAWRRPPVCAWCRTSGAPPWCRAEEHTSELQSLMRTSYAVFCLKKKKCVRRKRIICAFGT